MKYENETACGCGRENEMPMEDLTNMLQETRAMAQETKKLADRIDDHFFGRRGETTRCGEEKCAEPVNFKENLADTRRALKETIDVLAKLCTMVGV